jgi:hypothetical protein
MHLKLDTGCAEIVGVYSPCQANSPVAITIPASGTAWKNPTGNLIQIFMTGGTVSVVSVARNGVSMGLGDLLGANPLLGPWDSITWTYVLAPTAFYIELI